MPDEVVEGPGPGVVMEGRGVDVVFDELGLDVVWDELGVVLDELGLDEVVAPLSSFSLSLAQPHWVELDVGDAVEGDSVELCPELEGEGVEPAGEDSVFGVWDSG